MAKLNKDKPYGVVSGGGFEQDGKLFDSFGDEAGQPAKPAKAAAPAKPAKAPSEVDKQIAAAGAGKGAGGNGAPE